MQVSTKQTLLQDCREVAVFVCEGLAFLAFAAGFTFFVAVI